MSKIIKLIFSLFWLSNGLISQEIEVIQIGNQTWMKDNMAIKSGDFNSVVLDSSTMQLNYVYNWATASQICPIGFRLPNNQDWNDLIDFVGGFKRAGTILKRNKAGNFNATLAGNYLPSGGFFNYLNDYGYYWSSVEFNGNTAWAYVFGEHQSNVNRTTIPKHYYLSVRCIRSNN